MKYQVKTDPQTSYVSKARTRRAISSVEVLAIDDRGRVLLVPLSAVSGGSLDGGLVITKAAMTEMALKWLVEQGDGPIKWLVEQGTILQVAPAPPKDLGKE